MAARKKDAEPLTRERIIDAAMHVIDTDGVDALSMRRLGTELGVNPMAAYHYVPNKAALYDLVLDAVMEGVDLTTIDSAAPIEERLKQAARAYRNAIFAHPNAIPVLSGRSVRSRIAMRPVEAFVGLLFEAGLESGDSIAAVDCIAQFVLGGAVGYYHHVHDAELSQVRDFDPITPEEFPNMSRVLVEGHFIGHDGEFEFGLDAIVRGLLSGPCRER
jgi:TetR/AcrR family transcriptional regulator, tetracycline repressor protein